MHFDLDVSMLCLSFLFRSTVHLLLCLPVKHRYNKPFDRHDWVVERSNGEEVRYVIDFYTGARAPGNRSQPISIYLDVRPAADSVSAVVARLSFSVRQRFQPLSLPKWCLMGSPFFKAIHNASEKGGEKK